MNLQLKMEMSQKYFTVPADGNSECVVK